MNKKIYWVVTIILALIFTILFVFGRKPEESIIKSDQNQQEIEEPVDPKIKEQSVVPDETKASGEEEIPQSEEEQSVTPMQQPSKP